MDNRVTIIGFTGSGKTTYLAGMYDYMSGTGCNHFSLVAVDPNQDVTLENLWDDLSDGIFPAPNNDAEEFTFHLAYHYQPVCDFEWLDYPGGILADPKSKHWPKLRESVRTSDCLLLVLDGEIFQIDAADGREYAEKLSAKINANRGLKRELKQFSRLSQEGIDIPPVCVMVTKSDLLDKQYKDIMKKVIRREMDETFLGNSMVMVTAVSVLGHASAQNGLHPFCIEEPIAFAVLTVLLKYMRKLQEQKSRQRGVVNKKRNFFTKWLDSKEIADAKNVLANLAQLGDKWQQDAAKLIHIFDAKAVIYVNDNEENFREYMRWLFEEINK